VTKICRKKKKSNRGRTAAGHENVDSDEYFLGIHEEIGESIGEFNIEN
jgi:hypothetical protein